LLVAKHARLALRGYLEITSFAMSVRRQRSRRKSKGYALIAAEICQENKGLQSDAMIAKKQS
jgi:hypothetical protein